MEKDRTIQAVATYIAQNKLLAKGQPVGVALSGGADSIALLDILTNLGYDCIALHCNFHLRGEESDRDQHFTEDFAHKTGIPIHVAHMDVPARQAATGESVEMACRSLRYEWFKQMTSNLNLQAVTVAHHADDQVETFFLNLLRGSGVKGLSGMKPRNGYIVRPMLSVTRDEIIEYLDRNGLNHVTDSTNLCNDFKRNRLRNELIPLLNKLFPGASPAIIKSMENLAVQNHFIEDTVTKLNERYTSDGGSINLSTIIQNEAQPAEVLFEMLKSDGFNLSTINDIIRSSTKSGKTFHGKEKSYILDRGTLIPHDRAFDSQPKLSWEILNREELGTFRCTADTLLLDDSAIDGNPQWEIRRWRKGDRIEPFGMKGSRLLSDIYSDAQISIVDKQDQWVLTRDGVILWAIGLRTSRHFPITPSSKRILILKSII